MSGPACVGPGPAGVGPGPPGVGPCPPGVGPGPSGVGPGPVGVGPGSAGVGPAPAGVGPGPAGVGPAPAGVEILAQLLPLARPVFFFFLPSLLLWLGHNGQFPSLAWFSPLVWPVFSLGLASLHLGLARLFLQLGHSLPPAWPVSSWLFSS